MSRTNASRREAAAFGTRSGLGRRKLHGAVQTVFAATEPL
jgi:hypothetical protein